MNTYIDYNIQVQIYLFENVLIYTIFGLEGCTIFKKNEHIHFLTDFNFFFFYRDYIFMNKQKKLF